MKRNGKLVIPIVVINVLMNHPDRSTRPFMKLTVERVEELDFDRAIFTMKKGLASL